jgi:hypothetical protein
MKNKRGQFFILSAIIIVSILAGIYIFRNQIIETTYFSPRCEEFKTEINQVIDSCVFRSSDCSSELNQILDYIEESNYEVEFCYKNIKRNYLGTCSGLEYNFTRKLGDNIYVCSN